MEIKYNKRTNEGKYYIVSLGIGDINYENITPKFISSDDNIMSYFYAEHIGDNLDDFDTSYYKKLSNYEKFQCKKRTGRGVNAIDIDWNGAVLSNNIPEQDKIKINTTSDLLKIIKSTIINSPEELWEDKNYDPNQNL